MGRAWRAPRALSPSPAGAGAGRGPPLTRRLTEAQASGHSSPSQPPAQPRTDTRGTSLLGANYRYRRLAQVTRAQSNLEHPRPTLVQLQRTRRAFQDPPTLLKLALSAVSAIRPGFHMCGIYRDPLTHTYLGYSHPAREPQPAPISTPATPQGCPLHTGPQGLPDLHPLQLPIS